MFKKTAIAALVLGFSGAASAAMYAPAPAPHCAAGNVTVPCERSAWDLGVDVLYARSEDNQASTVAGFRAKYGWGFRLEGSYHFGTGNDATLNWSHYNKGSGVRQGVLFRSQFDWVNFEIGQHVDFGENVDVRFFGGVEYVNVVDNAFGGPLIRVADPLVNGRYTGFGPRAGATAKYDFGNGFGVYSDAAMGLVVGKARDRTNGQNFYGSALTTEAGIGVSYTHAMAQGDLTGRLGWGVKQVNGAAGGVDSWNVFNLGLKWVGNV